jgi:hypothetical protein
MKIATDRATVAAIRPIHNARAALGYRPAGVLDQYACGGKQILLLLPAEREATPKNSARTRKQLSRTTDFTTAIVQSTDT